MNDEIITAVVNINDLDLGKLGLKLSNLSSADKDILIIERLKKEYSQLPGKVTFEQNGDYLIIKYSQEIIDEEDESILGKALNLLTEKKFNAGREYLLNLVEKYPLNTRILYNLGMCYSEMGQPERSIKPLEQAIKMAPFYANAYVALGVSYSRLGNIEKALEYGLESIRYDSKNFYGYRNVAACYGILEQHEKALEYNNKALELDANDPQALYSQAKIYQQLGNLSEADKFFKKIIDNGVNDQIISLAKQDRTKIADNELLSKGIRMDAVMYLISALKLFQNLAKEKVKQITFAASIMGMKGFDINNPDKKYYFKELEKECTGLQMLCYMYAGFQIIDPTLSVGIDLAKEYNMAKEMAENGIS